MLIALYGINNIGKSTQAKILLQNFEKAGIPAEYVKYPVYELSPSGPFLNKILREKNSHDISEEELQMWFTLNRMQFENELREKLAAGKHIIAEDYIGTGLAWGSAKGADLSWLEQINAPLLAADLNIYFYGARFTKSIEAGHLHEENQDLMDKSTISHSALAEKYKWNKIKVEGITETSEKVWGIVSSAIEELKFKS